MKSVVDEKPFISIIVPVYNASNTIAECVSALLATEYPEDKREIIVVDNNSLDTTAEIVKQFPVIYLKEADVQSSYAARNKGIQHAKGEIFAFTDSDCIPDSAWLRKGVENFNDELVGAVAGRIIGAKPDTLVEEFLQSSNYLGAKVCLCHSFLPYIQTANAFYRRTVLDDIGIFNQKMVSGGDADLAWRMQLQTKYTISYNEEAVVVHKHRATVRNFYRQMYTHGIGQADLENMYLLEMEKKRLRLEVGKPFIYAVLRVAFSFVYHTAKAFLLLLTLQGHQAVFEMINWYGKVGKRAGVLSRKGKYSGSTRK